MHNKHLGDSPESPVSEKLLRKYYTSRYIHFIIRLVVYYQALSHKSTINRKFSELRYLYHLNMRWTQIYSNLSPLDQKYVIVKSTSLKLYICMYKNKCTKTMYQTSIFNLTVSKTTEQWKSD